jgi:colicin import membrane protein
MPETLADLTLRLSQEISSIEALGARELAEAERERDRALLEVEPARAILSRFHKALEKAKQDQIEAAQEADDRRHREIQDAEAERREKLAREELSQRDARGTALERKNEATRKANAKWKLAVDKAKGEPLSEQRRLRLAADEALERALEQIRESYKDAIEETRLAHQAAIQDQLVEERFAGEAAHRKAERATAAAAIAYERAVALEEAKLRSELASFPEAQKAQETHDRRVAEIRESCERAKEALFQRFTRERRVSRR